MIELPLSYLKEIATQLIFISVFLGGFSASILGTLIMSEHHSRVFKALIVGAALAAVSFVVSVFAMTKIVMMSVPGYPSEMLPTDTVFPRTIGVMAFFLGLLALLFVIAASGWLHSKRLGLTTTLIGLLGLIIILLVS